MCERAQHDVVDGLARASRLILEDVLQLPRHAQEDDGARAREGALAAGGAVGDVEVIGEESNGDVVERDATAGCLADKCLL